MCLKSVISTGFQMCCKCVRCCCDTCTNGLKIPCTDCRIGPNFTRGFLSCVDIFGPSVEEAHRRLPKNIQKIRNNIDWNKDEHRRIVASVLVQAVYLLEYDRVSILRPRKAAKKWWKAVGFHPVEKLYEGPCCSPCGRTILGAIFKHDPPANAKAAAAQTTTASAGGAPPEYVIAFRGTASLWDAMVDTAILSGSIDKTTRIVHANNGVNGFLGRPKHSSVLKSRGGGGPKLWLAGHSLGATVAMSVAMALKQRGEVDFDTFLFNLPFLGVPETGVSSGKGQETNLSTQALMQFEQTAEKVLDSMFKGIKNPRELMAEWTPNLYVNPNDIICMLYVPYFQKNWNSSAPDSGVVSTLTATNGLDLNIGFNMDVSKELSLKYMLRSAMMHVNKSQKAGKPANDMWAVLKQWGNKLMEAHSLEQWYNSTDLPLDSKKYVLDKDANAAN